MIAKLKQHAEAIALRKKGYSYSEIADLLSVSQSTLSLWLKDIVIGDKYIQILTDKQRKGQLKGASIKRTTRKRQEELILAEAIRDIKGISKKELLLLGSVIYWCEGAKQKENNISQGVVFSNSDPFLIKLFLKWVREICKIQESNIKYNLCIHENANIDKAVDYWSKVVIIPRSRFGKTVLKKHNIKTNRKNTEDNYYGLMRLSISKSTNLNRKIAAWIYGVDSYIN